MGRYRKKPLVIEAEPFKSGMEDGIEHVKLGEVPDAILEAWFGDAVLQDPAATRKAEEIGEVGQSDLEADGGLTVGLQSDSPAAAGPTFQVPFINTLEGKHYILPTDVIVTGVHGERYPVKKDIFEKTYEPDPLGALPREIEEAEKHLVKSRQDYYALGRFIPAIRNELGALGARWDIGERTLLLCQEIMAIKVPAA